MRPLCDYRRGYGLRCGTPMRERFDALGRVHFDCPTCDRRLAGRCADCPAPVDGKVGVALTCAACRKERRRVAALRHWHRHHEQNCARRRRRERIHATHPMLPQESGRRGGLIGGRRPDRGRRRPGQAHAGGEDRDREEGQCGALGPPAGGGMMGLPWWATIALANAVCAIAFVALWLVEVEIVGTAQVSAVRRGLLVGTIVVLALVGGGLIIAVIVLYAHRQAASQRSAQERAA